MIDVTMTIGAGHRVRFGTGECVVALLVAPLVIVPVTFAASLLLALVRRWPLSAPFYIIVLAIGYACTLLVGLPVSLLLQRSERLSRTSLITAGALIGLLPAAAIWITATRIHPRPDDASQLMFLAAFGSAYGTATAGAAWALMRALHQRPNPS